jgi:hypothetical protein
MREYLQPMKASRFLFVLAALAVLAGCPTATNSPTYTVHGTVTLTDLSATGNATVTVTQGANSYPVSVAVPAGNPQTVSYSVPGVPAGTYSVSVSIVTPNSGLSGSYQVNGGAAQSVTAQPSGTGPYTQTVAVASIVVSVDIQLDASFVPAYTVHGTVTVPSNVIAGSSVITVTSGTHTYTVSVPVVNTQKTWTYSISGVLAGTYTVSFTFDTNSSAPGGTCLFNLGTLPGSIVVGQSGATVTMTVDSIPVNADAQLDPSFSWT